MFIAAIAHHFSFSSTPFVDPDAQTTGHSVRRFNLSSDRHSTNRRNRGCPYNPNLSCEDRNNTDTSNSRISFDSESSPLLPNEEITSVEVVTTTTTTTNTITLNNNNNNNNVASLTTSEYI
ncbi:unnamed protein product [Trichobilharzia regenti]|nr:unnamed protein product [Trichobilharzia regenti]